MNSLNHYAYGSIADWMYRYMCGFHPDMAADIKMIIKPVPDKRFSYVKGSFESVFGTYKSEWEYDENGYPVKIGSGNIDPDEPQSGSLLGTWTGDNAIVAAMGSYTFEFNADGTVVYTENTYGTTTAYNGTWSLSGTSLTMDFSGSSYQNPSLISGTGKIDIASDGSSFTFDGTDNFGNNENWGTFYRK